MTETDLPKRTPISEGISPTQQTLAEVNTTFKDYLKSFKNADLYFDFINLRAMVDSGLAVFLVAPPSGAKSTLIKALEIDMSDKRYCYNLQRISPMRLLKLQYHMNNNDVLFVSEDFSTIGDSEDSVFKMSTIITMLSYDGRYSDPFYATKDNPDGLNIMVKSLAFICGMQPQWLQIYGNREVFDTLIMEKIPRYYRLPIMPIADIERQTSVIDNLTIDAKRTRKHTYKPTQQLIDYFADALKVQCGARGKEYAEKFVPELAKYVPESCLQEWVIQTAMRFRFEEHFLMRGFEPLKRGIQHEALWREYMVLFFAMQYNPLTYSVLKDLAKIRGKKKSATTRYMTLLIGYALDAGYINVTKGKKLIIFPSDDYQKYSIHKFSTKSFLSKSEQKENGSS